MKRREERRGQCSHYGGNYCCVTQMNAVHNNSIVGFGVMVNAAL